MEVSDLPTVHVQFDANYGAGGVGGISVAAEVAETHADILVDEVIGVRTTTRAVGDGKTSKTTARASNQTDRPLMDTRIETGVTDDTTMGGIAVESTSLVILFK